MGLKRRLNPRTRPPRVSRTPSPATRPVAAIACSRPRKSGRMSVRPWRRTAASIVPPTSTSRSTLALAYPVCPRLSPCRLNHRDCAGVPQLQVRRRRRPHLHRRAEAATRSSKSSRCRVRRPSRGSSRRRWFLSDEERSIILAEIDTGGGSTMGLGAITEGAEVPRDMQVRTLPGHDCAEGPEGEGLQVLHGRQPRRDR